MNYMVHDHDKNNECKCKQLKDIIKNLESKIEKLEIENANLRADIDYLNYQSLDRI